MVFLLQTSSWLDIVYLAFSEQKKKRNKKDNVKNANILIYA